MPASDVPRHIEAPPQRWRVDVGGTVQGVGFRPFVHRLASRLGVTGVVGNDGEGVWCEIEGAPAALSAFVERLTVEAPPLASIRSIEHRSLGVLGDETGFVIAASDAESGRGLGLIPPDVAPCAACLEEVGDPDDHRAGYPFTCCTECGPRFTVIRQLPYDREHTSMVAFPLCVDCAAEYRDPASRRFHAQATCCAACGPRLSLRRPDGAPCRGDPLREAAKRLRRGDIVALKGVGGYQLLCRADDDAAVRTLRRRKVREQKPFAVLVASIADARDLVELDHVAERALTGPERPIVLAPRRLDGTLHVTDQVAPDSGLLGVMLPASPLHALLCDATGSVLVCTSANLTDEPIAIDDNDASVRLSRLADVLLVHDRPIERRADDSVGHVVAGRFQLLRRARGYAPRPIMLPSDGPPVLGVGAELKNTVCLAVGFLAQVSVHIGDLEHVAALRAFEETIADQIVLAGRTPELVVHDLHPEYLPTKFAAAQTLAPTLAVQHHHAHLASCLVDAGHVGPAIGVTFDGLGWGTDGTAWGGEVLVGDATGYRRAAHLRPVALPGGVAAIREPWRMAAAHIVEAPQNQGSAARPGLRCATGEDLPDVGALRRHADELDVVVGQCRAGHSMQTSSMGRLFDAVAALCDLTDEVDYEGQAAVRLEQVARLTGRTYPWAFHGHQPIVAEPAPVIAAVVDDLRAGRSIAEVAGAFHRSVADLVVALCRRLSDDTGVVAVALTGGVFQNRLLVELIIPDLLAAGLIPLRHTQVPPNDGGISLGQVAIGRESLAR